jgi:CheY-like chemotaxis protein
MGQALSGRTLLVVEDEFLVGEDLRRILAEAGADTIGPVDDPSEACAIALQRPIDGALLDVRLGEGSCIEVADLLERRHIPFIVVTGYNREHIPRALRAAPFVGKPILRAPLLSLAQTIFLPASRT